MDYATSGVDIKKEEDAIASLSKYVKQTLQLRDGKVGAALTGLGHFSGLVDLGDKALAISTDGVGTKILVGKELGRYETLSIDLMAMNVNDIICVGATPITFVDTISVQTPNNKIMADIGKGLLEAARQAEVTIVGGETATVPELLEGNGDGIDLMGTAVGIVDKDKIITGKDISPGDIVLGIESSGIHSNGLTLARKVVPRSKYPLLLEPTRIYVGAILELLEHIRPNGLVHITGGGLLNLKRLKENVGFSLLMPQFPTVFQIIKQNANISNDEMYKTFNMGVGFMVIVKEEDAKKSCTILNRHFPTFELGKVTGTGIIEAFLPDGTTIKL
ncbi:MAG: phosphoribosylformylglycinamidine cyclo-ligase [Candidatus Methanofastidiosia archaeon]